MVMVLVLVLVMVLVLVLVLVLVMVLALITLHFLGCSASPKVRGFMCAPCPLHVILTPIVESANGPAGSFDNVCSFWSAGQLNNN